MVLMSSTVKDVAIVLVAYAIAMRIPQVKKLLEG